MKRVSKSQRVSAYSATNPPAIRIGLGETFVMETNDRFQGYTSRDDAPLDLLMSMTGPVYVGGVEPGETLAVAVLDITPSTGYGWIVATPGPSDVEASRPSMAATKGADRGGARPVQQPDYATIRTDDRPHGGGSGRRSQALQCRGTFRRCHEQYSHRSRRDGVSAGVRGRGTADHRGCACCHG